MAPVPAPRRGPPRCRSAASGSRSARSIHRVEPAPALRHRRFILRAPFGRDLGFAIVAGRPPLAAGEIRGRVGRHLGGVDGDWETRLLHQPRGGQAHHPRADHRDRSFVPGEAKADRQPRGPPAERDARAAVPIIVDQRLLAERLAAHDEPRGAIRAEAGIGSRNLRRREVDRDQQGCSRRSAAGRSSRSPTAPAPTLRPGTRVCRGREAWPRLSRAGRQASTVSTVSRSLVNTHTSAAIAIARRASFSGSGS